MRGAGVLDQGQPAETAPQHEDHPRRPATVGNGIGSSGPEDQPADLAGVAAGQGLRHHPTHRVTGHGRRLQLEGVHHPGCLICQVLDRVAPPDAARAAVVALVHEHEPKVIAQGLDEAMPGSDAVVSPAVEEEQGGTIRVAPLAHHELPLPDEHRAPAQACRMSLRRLVAGSEVGPEQPPRRPSSDEVSQDSLHPGRG